MTITSARPTRRTLVRGAAWSVPAVSIAAAAPAFAASCGQKEVLSWANYVNGSVFSSATFGTTTVTIGQTGNLGPDSGKVIHQPEGGVNPALRFYPANGVDGSSVTVTVSFNRQVKDLSFSLLDIDSANPAWRDRIEILTPTTGATLGSQVTGSGTADDPYRALNNGALANTSPNGNVLLSWAGPISTVSFRYYQVGSPTGTPHTGLSNVNFTTIC